VCIFNSDNNMNTLEFVVQLLDKLVWPLTLFVLLYLVRKELKDLIPFLKKARISELELEFDRDLAKVQSVAADEFKAVETDWKVTLITLAQNMPNAAILEAWKEIEKRAETLIHLIEPQAELDLPTRFKTMQNLLIKENRIETKKGKIFNDLRQIRNRVAHAESYTVNADQALSYVAIAIQLVEYLEEKIKAEYYKD
jgi:hypothetical protein